MTTTTHNKSDTPKILKDYLQKLMLGNLNIDEQAVPILSQVIGDTIETFEKRFENTDEESKKLLDNPPIWNEQITPQRYQTLALHFIQNLPFQYKLEYLNKLQSKCPFVLVDILRRPLNQPIQYGLADLYRFLGFNTQPTVKIGKIKQKQPLYQPLVPPVFKYSNGQLGQNPLYSPVNYHYPIPDIQGNMKLQEIFKNNPQFLFSKLKNIYQQITNYQKYIKGGGKSLTNKSHEKLYIKESYNDMLELINHILKRETDPYKLTNYIYSTDSECNTPPMATYFRNNFDALLFQLISTNNIYKINSKPLLTDANLSSKALDDLKSYQKYYERNKMLTVSASSAYKSKSHKSKSHKYSHKRHTN
jgi:hypothetical protein